VKRRREGAAEKSGGLIYYFIIFLNFLNYFFEMCEKRISQTRESNVKVRVFTYISNGLLLVYSICFEILLARNRM
jgi:hypothetical protein